MALKELLTKELAPSVEKATSNRAEIDRLAAEIRGLTRQKRELENERTDSLETIIATFSEAGIDSLTINDHIVSVYEGQWSVIVEDEDEVDTKFFKKVTKLQLLKDLVLTTFKQGGDIGNGVKVVRGKSVRIS